MRHQSIHIKVDYSEAVENKKNMLLLEKSMLEVVKHIKAYDILRRKEFTLKTQIKRDFAKIISLISEIESVIPKEETHFSKDKLKKEEKIKAITVKKHKAEMQHKKSQIESQIDEIRAKLARLG